MSIEKNFEKIYRNFRLHLYKHIFEIMGEREGSLTVTEFFAVETIGLMDNPTVGEFADCLCISSPLAAYKVHKLMEKGYIVKEQGGDRRCATLQVTDKFRKYYHEEDSYGRYIFDILSETLTPEELEQTDKLFEKFVKTIEGEKGGGEKGV